MTVQNSPSKHKLEDHENINIDMNSIMMQDIGSAEEPQRQESQLFE